MADSTSSSSSSGDLATRARSWFEAHRTPTLAILFGGAILLGLRARAKGQASTASTGSGNAGAAAGEQTFAGAAGSYYDSTANDVYNAMEPQIAALASQLNALQQTPSSTDGSTTVTTPPAPTPQLPIRHVAPGTKWGVGSTGTPGSVPAPTPTGNTGATHVGSGASWGITGNR